MTILLVIQHKKTEVFRVIVVNLCMLSPGKKEQPRGEVGGWGRDPKKCTGRDWGMGSSTI